MATAPKMIRTKTPGVFKRGNRYAVVFYDANGRQRKEAARTYELARALKRQRDSEVATGAFVPAGKLTFHEYAREWIENYNGKRKGIRKRTKADYRRDLEAYAFRYFTERTRLAAVGTRDADAFIAWLLDATEQERQLSTRTVERILVPVSGCFTAAVRHGLVASNPFESAVVPHPDQIEEDVVKTLTPGQLRDFLLTVPPDWSLFFETLASTGARWSEAIAWRRRDLDLAEGCLKVRRSLYEGEPQPPKTRHSRRSIPLADELIARLERATLTLSADDLIFSAANGAPLRAENVRRRQLKPTGKEIGAPWIGFHTFRHTAASLLFAGGANVVRVQRFLGHHSPAFTLDTYIHLLDHDLGPGLDLRAIGI
jgi:integrase